MSTDLLHTTSELWDHAPVVDAIAASSDWQATVAVEAHRLAHPKPVYACPGCVPVACPWCGSPESVCEDPSGHERLSREGETSLLQVGVGHYGKPVAG
jgi:hypothetical protein